MDKLKCTRCGDDFLGKCHCEKCYISERQNWRKSVKKLRERVKQLEDRLKTCRIRFERSRHYDDQEFGKELKALEGKNEI